MLPTYIKEELVRRLSPSRARSLAKSLGIDPERLLPTLEPQFIGRYEYSGSVDFDLTVSALGHCQSIPCRLSFTADLTDHEDPRTGEPVRILGRSQQLLHALIWTGDDEQPLEWSQLDERILPRDVILELDDRVEEKVRGMERNEPG